MGVRILRGDTDAVMYCSTTDWAFGPVFSDTKEHDAAERAEAFIRWLAVDARKYTDTELESKYNEWLGQEAIQWKVEEMNNEL